jgi:hypothetical protein
MGRLLASLLLDLHQSCQEFAQTPAPITHPDQTSGHASLTQAGRTPKVE